MISTPMSLVADRDSQTPSQSTSLSEIQVFDSLDVPDSSRVERVQPFKFRWLRGHRGKVRDASRGQRTATNFELLIRVLAPAEREALLAARTILRLAIEAVVT